MRRSKAESEKGFVLMAVLMMASLILTLLGVYFVTTSNETASMRYTKGASSGFYGSEAGLNLRAETIRQIFVGFNRPTGTSPNTSNPCQSGNNGSGDFACQTKTFNNRSVKSFIQEDASNPKIITVPPGERYQNLNAQEYRYTAKSQAFNNLGNMEADLELRFKSRLVPLFQFAAFYNKDLEILPGPAMSLAGPVHTNGSLYLYSNSATLTIQGQVTTAGDLWRGRKDGSVTPSCNNQAVYVYDPLTARSLVPNCPSRHMVTSTEIAPFNNMIQTKVQPVTVPGPEVFDATAGHVYWDHADLRLALALDNSNNPTGIQVRNSDNSVNNSATTTLNACPGIFPGSKCVQTTTMFNFRENKTIRLLDVDMIGVLNCLKNSNWFATGKLLSDNTDGGLVFHLTVKGPDSLSLPNSYGVRVQNAATIASTVNGAPAIKGFTIVSDQSVYTKGNYNSTNKLPAAIMADTINVLSQSWNDANSSLGIGSRVVGADVTINAAWLSGTDVTGGIEGSGGQGGYYNGGLENFPRFHENWSGRRLTYRGSIVSLGTPQHSTGRWTAQSYSPPSRDWNYDVSFNNAANLPPITPRFVYLKQELFVRDFGD